MTHRDAREKEEATEPCRKDATRRFAFARRFLGGLGGIHLFWAFVACLSIGFLWSAFSGPRGIHALVEQGEKWDRIHRENRVLLERNQTIEKEIYLLRTSPSYLRKVAREELGYIEEGETIYLPAEESRGTATSP